jgi:general secretion pathway protein D
MRPIIFLLLALHSFLSHAADATIKTVTQDGVKAYELHVGNFPQENNALQAKLKLSSLLKQPTSIEFQKDKKTYVIKIGPIKDLTVAQNIQGKLKDDIITPVPNKEKNATIASTESNGDSDLPLEADKKLWNLSNADIRAVIAEVSRVTGKNFIIDPRVQGKISIVSGTPLSDDELYQVFLSMLQISGYAALPSGSVIKIVPNIDAKTTSYNPVGAAKGDEMLVEVIPVHYVPADQLVPVLRPLIPQWGNVSSYAPSNMLILSGRADTIKRMAEIIRQVDSSANSGIDIVPLRYALAMDMVTTLKDLVRAPGATSGGGGPGGPGGQGGIPGGGGALGQASIAADDRNNAILISGTKTERIRLRLLIEQLDKQGQNSNSSNTQVVYLSYLRAEDLAPILEGVAKANFSGIVGTTVGTVTLPTLDSTNPASSIVNNPANGTSITGTSSGSGSPLQNSPALTGSNQSPPGLPNTSGAATQEGTTKPIVQIIAEPNTNSIIINAPASIVRILKSVIYQLDIKPAQILIEALVAEIDEDVVNNLGVEWGTNSQTGDPLLFSPGFAIVNSQTSLSDFQAEVFALVKEQKANILSKPSVVVLDNRQAKILVGKQVSVTQSTFPNNAGGLTPGSPYETFNRVNVALHLYVRPQITRGQGIQLQIDQGNDTIQPGSETSTNPIFNVSAIVTSVHVESGDTVVLGGLLENSLSNNNNRLPILGDVPGIGRLFQRIQVENVKKVLMVFIRPIILRNSRDALQVTGEKYQGIRETQLEYLRSQETYNSQNDETLLPPLTEDDLPKPFSKPIQRSIAATGPGNVRTTVIPKPRVYPK